MPKQTLNSDFLDRGMVFVKGDLKQKLYRKKCSMAAFLQNSCRRAGWKTDKTLANALRLYSALALGGFGQFWICRHLWLCYGLPVKRKIKKESWQSNISLMRDSPWWRDKELVKPGSTKSSTKRLNGLTCKNVQTRLKACCEHCTLQLLKTCGCAPLTGPGLRGELCMFHLVHVWSCMSDFFLYLFGGFTNRGWWIESGLWITFGGSWTHVGTLGYYWVGGLECLQFKVLRSKYEYVVHFCPPSIVSEQRQPAYAKRAWCIFESYVLSWAKRAFKTCEQFQMNVQ